MLNAIRSPQLRRYQHATETGGCVRRTGGERTALVAELSGEIFGFIDARLEQSLDARHRELMYCHMAEIAVSSQYQNQGIGRRLLRAAENWGRDQGAGVRILWNIMPQTPAPACSIRSVWAIA